MAVQPQTPYKEYTANGSTNSFALEFDCDNQDHLIVLVDDIEPVVGTWSLSGGAVVFGTAPTNGKKITIQRNTPFRRDGDFQSYDNSFRPGPVNKGLDKVWLKLQELGVADWILSSRIDALKAYVDDQDDELRAYLLEEIRKQGVALDQLDDYYNYLMQRLAQIAVDKGWDASFVVDGDKNQKQINDEIKSKISRYPTILDFLTPSELITYNTNPNMDCTAIIKRAFATGIKKLNFLDLQMHITLKTTGADTLATFTDGDIELYGNGATFIDNTNHNMNEAITALFELKGNVNSFNSNVNYVGKIVSLTTEIGYKGATYVFSQGANKNITVNAYLKNIRYGILAGNYANPALGGAKTIRGSLQCRNVGYPIATYLADDIEMTITGDGFHRVHYIAGCNHARITTRVKNYYNAPIPHLYSDAKTGEGTSKGCTDCETDATDMGTTLYMDTAYLLGISLSRVDPYTIFDGVTLKGTIKATDTQASHLGLIFITSSAKNYNASYTTNWVNSIELNNITLMGLIDRTKQATAATPELGELYVAAMDDISVLGEKYYPKISNLKMDVVFKKGGGTHTRGFWGNLHGLTDYADIKLKAKGSGINAIVSNTTSLVRFRDSEIVGTYPDNAPSENSAFEFVDTIISNPNYLPLTNKRFVNTKINGVYPKQIKTISNELVLTGSTVTWENVLPYDALIVGISFVLTEAISGTSGLALGLPTAITKFYNVLTTAQGAAVGISNATVGSLPYITQGNKSLVVTARDGATFTTGKIKIVVDYIDIGLPTI